MKMTSLNKVEELGRLIGNLNKTIELIKCYGQPNSIISQPEEAVKLIISSIENESIQP